MILYICKLPNTFYTEENSKCGKVYPLLESSHQVEIKTYSFYHSPFVFSSGAKRTCSHLLTVNCRVILEQTLEFKLNYYNSFPNSGQTPTYQTLNLELEKGIKKQKKRDRRKHGKTAKEKPSSVFTKI